MTVKYKKIQLPAWPKERDLERYSDYTKIDFKQSLRAEQVWIDIGCRTGKALSQSRKICRAKLVGVNAHDIKVRAGIEPIFAAIPENKEVYKKFRKKTDWLTDIYGAVSYCEDPLKALIYETCLLKPNGTAVIILLQARIGTLAVLKRIKLFFNSVLKQQIKFEKFITYSDNTKTPLKTLRITIHGHCQSKLGFENLFILAKKEIGEIQKKKLIWRSEDGSAEQWRVIYG